MPIDYKLVEQRMAQQRKARLEKEAQEAKEKAAREHRLTAAGFWDNINSSGGVDSCHIWEGQLRWNHPSTYKGERYQSPIFEGYEGCDSVYAQRVACFATYGRNVPADMDVTNICGERRCINLRHMAVVKHGGNGDARLNTAIPVEEFFCDVVDVLRKGGFEVVEGADAVLKAIKDAA